MIIMMMKVNCDNGDDDKDGGGDINMNLELSVCIFYSLVTHNPI